MFGCGSHWCIRSFSTDRHYMLAWIIKEKKNLKFVWSFKYNWLMVQIVIAAPAKGMDVANLTLEESFMLLNTSLRPFLSVGKYSDQNSSIDNSCRASASLGQARNSAFLLTSIIQRERNTLYILQNHNLRFLGGPVCWKSKLLGLSAG